MNPLTNPVGYSFPPQILTPHANDVLSGRGVNIAQHPGNERFRKLVQNRYDADYCQRYTIAEKRALAEEIIAHIHSLDPPGRFLKRQGRSNTQKGLQGPWDELPYQEIVRKTTQALRDCSRPDRTGYAALVQGPEDVRISEENRQQLGLSNKEYAERIAKRGHISPSVENAAEWLLKKPKTTHDAETPTTAASSLLPDTGLDSYDSPHHHYAFDRSALDPLSDAAAALEGDALVALAPDSPFQTEGEDLYHED